MYFRSTLEHVRALFPEALDAAVAILRQGRSKRAKEPLVSFDWGFEVAVACEPPCIADITSGSAIKKRDAYEALSLKDKLRDFERHAEVSILGTLLGRRYLQSERLPTVPTTVLEAQRRHLVAQEAERRPYSALSRAE